MYNPKSWCGKPATNTCLYSERFDLWTKQNATVVQNASLAPNNSFTAALVYPTSTSASSVYQSNGLTGSQTQSVYAKAAGKSFLWFINAAGSNGAAWFNLSTGTVGTVVSGFTATITPVVDGWYRCTVTVASGSWAFIQLGISDTDNSLSITVSGTNGVLLWGGQVESGAYATPYIPTSAATASRSTAQVLLDQLGVTTLTASSLTYASDNTFSFNGTSDYMRPTAPVSYLSSSSIEYVFKPTALPGAGLYKTLVGYSGLSGYSEGVAGLTYLTTTGTIMGSVITASQTYRTVQTTAVVQAGVNIHVVFNKNVETGVMDIYINGVFNATQSFDPATYAQWVSAGSYLNITTLDIGNNINSSQSTWVGNFFSGSMPLVRMYDRVLTATEVTQNFNAIRGRYGL
jgi:hypothetical protein